MMRIKLILALATMISVMVSISPSAAFAQGGTSDVLVSVDVAPVDVVAEPRGLSILTQSAPPWGQSASRKVR